ncbi:MAG: sugar kinase [Lachnospiraceae bacterium]|nr:sugar kinase [Lachnospiraceae bacterium]
MAEVMLFGEPMVMFVAETAQPLEDVEMFRRSLAGAELNVAIGLVRLGHSAAYCTKLGTDPFGKYAEKKIRSEGIEAQVSYDSRYWTGFQLKNRVSEGDPEVVYFRENSAASHMTVEDVDQLDFKEAKILHITGIPPALSRSCLEATCHLIETARSNGMLVSFDPNLRPSLWESREVMIKTINDLAAKADLVLPGTGEGRILMGSEDPEAIAEYYRAHGAKIVIVKNGSTGAYVCSDQYKKHCPGFRVEHVVDTVGAGDGFAVGVLSALLEGLSPEAAAIRGNAIGAIQVSVRSDNEGLPNRAELESFIANNRS